MLERTSCANCDSVTYYDEKDIEYFDGEIDCVDCGKPIIIEKETLGVCINCGHHEECKKLCVLKTTHVENPETETCKEFQKIPEEKVC